MATNKVVWILQVDNIKTAEVAYKAVFSTKERALEAYQRAKKTFGIEHFSYDLDAYVIDAYFHPNFTLGSE
jgi:hypothetical protein